MFKLRSMRSKIFSLLLMLLVSVGGFAQSKQVSGTVYDGTGMPFPGASVVVAGSTQGTITDMDGNFSMNVEDAASKTLNVSCIGFKSVNLAKFSKENLFVSLRTFPASILVFLLIKSSTSFLENEYSIFL